jgi:hypothetical protein
MQLGNRNTLLTQSRSAMTLSEEKSPILLFENRFLSYHDIPSPMAVLASSFAALGAFAPEVSYFVSGHHKDEQPN